MFVYRTNNSNTRTRDVCEGDVDVVSRINSSVHIGNLRTDSSGETGIALHKHTSPRRHTRPTKYERNERLSTNERLGTSTR